MRVLIPAILLGFLGLVACSPEVPNSAQRGVGFGTPSEFSQDQERRREALLEGRRLPGADGPLISSEVRGVTAVPVSPEVAGTTSLVALSPGTPGTGTLDAAGDLATDNAALSDEQNFAAVSGRETIESDAARLARQRASFEIVTPGALPERPKDTGPNIVAFALQTTNAVGQQVYRRSSVNAKARYDRACAAYTSGDLAQVAFLEAGGPESDRKGMDPDGDGFACTWDPSPFRSARR